MIQFEKHNRNLRELIDSYFSWQKYEFAKDDIDLDNAVNLDSIDAVLRKYLSKEEIHAEGSFFTGQKLAIYAVNAFDKPLTFSSIVLDPTCGAGNLLIECSRRLGIEKRLSKTLEQWGKVLWGFDIHQTFVEASKLRLVIEAIHRGCIIDCNIKNALGYLKNIKLKNAMEIVSTDIQCVTHLIMNPPFTLWSSPERSIWKKGKVNAAGVVFEHYLNIIPQHCYISAILPEVLRSGSRYLNLRSSIEQRVLGVCYVWGRFNKQTDVDVFILTGRVSRKNGRILWHTEDSIDKVTVADKFNVCIGPLVAYRDPKIGTEYPYFHAKNVINWSEIVQVEEKRRFSGKVIEPPFVVIKRTSSPSDAYRAAAAVINVPSKEVAVENHLIVLKPKSGKLEDCRNLIKILNSDYINCYLNQRIRLRHLTVSIIKSIPLD